MISVDEVLKIMKDIEKEINIFLNEKIDKDVKNMKELLGIESNGKMLI